MLRRQLHSKAVLAQRACSTARLSQICSQYPRAISIQAPSQPLIARPRTNPFRPSPTRAVRWHSSETANNKVYKFAEVQAISDSPNPDRILIDVREPSEYEQGFIPSSINIPVKTQPDALFLSEEEFQDRFGFEKPALDAEVIFYCKSGVRSSAAAYLARQHGYSNVAEYRGSWLDWTARDGKAARS